MADQLGIYVVVGSTPDEEAKPLEIFMEPQRAAQYVMNGLMEAEWMTTQGILRPGDQLSVLVTLGKEGDIDTPETMTSGSVAVVGSEHRKVWDFRVEKRWARRSTV